MPARWTSPGIGTLHTAVNMGATSTSDFVSHSIFLSFNHTTQSPYSVPPLWSTKLTIAEACILMSCLLPIACAGLAKSKGFGTPRHQGGFDNHHPRQWLASLQGWQARAHAAQQNSFEALPIFIAGVLIAERLQTAQQAHIDGLAMLFVGARIGYIAAYVADRAMLRSALWIIGLGACIGLYFTG